MQIIVSHVNTDFDALASLFAAKKLYPEAQVVISDKQNVAVKQFLTIYRETLDLVRDKDIDWSEITELIIVDVAALSRIGDEVDKLPKENVNITVYDHHPPKEGDVKKDDGLIEPTGAAVTLLIEKIRELNIPISSFEATLFGLGIYTDTGAFTYTNTTARDFQAAAYLMEQGMNLEIVHRFSDEVLSPEQHHILNQLFQASQTFYIDGLQIVVSTYEQPKFKQGLATLTQKLLDITDADAVLTVVGMKKRIYVVGRAASSRITLPPLLKKWKGGGHEQSGSATIKMGDRKAIFQEVTKNLDLIIKPAITARDMMASPVKTILPGTSIEEAGRLMYRYGHSGFPVAEEDELLGMITRRDLEKANHHGLGHAPVKAYMSTNVVSIEPDRTEEEIQQLIIERDIGRLPVVEDGKLVGIVTRTNIIEMLHHQKETEAAVLPSSETKAFNMEGMMQQQLPKELYDLLQEIGHTADTAQVPVYLIGGIVRDIFLGKENDDVDIVVEGDGINFAAQLQKNGGGDVLIHESFGTATWVHPSGLEIDVTSSRLEYYDRPAALPDVEGSTLKEDLYRRDFTINAMAVYLNREKFGQLVDPFRGRLDLKEKKVTILHNLSFVEDPTRIFRGVRFEVRFDFSMDQQTEQLALQSIDQVKDLSANRIVGEMKRLFKEINPDRGIKRLFELSFWQQFGVSGARVTDSFKQAERLKSWAAEEAFWFAYFLIPFYQEGNTESAKRFALTKKNGKLLQEVNDLTKVSEWSTLYQAGELHRYLCGYSKEAVLFVLAARPNANDTAVLAYLKKRGSRPTFLTGKDLIDQGLKPGAFFSEILFELDVAVLNGDVTTKAEALEWLRRYI